MSSSNEISNAITLVQGGETLGVLEPHIRDGPFVEGPFVPESSVEGKAFDTRVKALNLVEGYKTTQGVRVTWQKAGDGGEALCLGVSEVGLVLRLLDSEEERA